MQRDDFDTLVHRLHQRYADRPRVLRWWVALWVFVGYLVLIGWLPVVLVLGGIAVFGGTVLLPGSGVWLCLGAVLLAVGLIQTGLLLSVRIEPPKGVFVTRQAAPGLFDELDRVSKAVHCRQFHRVCLTADFNAGVHRTPRLGLLGWPRTSLSIGWPLFSALTLPEARAVLAHEFAHLSREHGRFGHWLYGLHQTWQQLVFQLQSGQQYATVRKLLGVLVWFLNAFWPRLNARLFVLSRIAEYEADRQAAEVMGADSLASSLWRINCSSLALNDAFWPDLRRAAAATPEPFDDVTRRMRNCLIDAPRSDHASRWMDQVCRGLTDQTDTHPSFADRAAAVGLDAESFRQSGFPTPPRASACDALFGSDALRFEQEVCVFWRRENRTAWRQQHGRSAVLTHRLNALDGAPSKNGGDSSALWERAAALADMHGLEAAEPVLRQLLASQPSHVYANLMLGQHLLERQSLEGIDLLRQVIASEQEDVVSRAGDLLAEHFRRTGESEQLQIIRRHMVDFETQLQAARKERSQVKASDTFLSHELSDAELEPLLTLLASSETREAWLAQKALRHFPQRRLFVLCVESAHKGWRGNADRDAALVRSLVPQVRLPGQTLVIAPTGSFAAIAKRIKRVPGSPLTYRAAR